MPPELFGRVSREIPNRKWPWADQAHIAFQDIPQFRQLVEARASEKATETGQSIRIGRSSPDLSRPSVIVRNLTIVKQPSVPTRAVLAEECWGSDRQTDGHPEACHHRGQNNQACGCGDQVE